MEERPDFTGAKFEDFKIINPLDSKPEQATPTPAPTPEPEIKPAEEPKPEPKVEPPKPEQPIPPTPIPTPEQPKKTRKEVLNELGPREELLKELDLDDFDIDLIKYRKATGDVTPYLEVKSVNWKDMTAEDVMKRNLREKYPKLSTEAFQLLYDEEVTRKYNLDADISEPLQQEVGKARLANDAEVLRAQYLEKQAKFKAPDIVPDDTAQKQELARQQQMEDFRQSILTNAATQSLLKDKKLDFGSGEHRYKYEVTNPQDLVDLLLDGNKYGAKLSKADGTPDTDKMLRIAAFINDEDNITKSWVDYGKSLGAKKVIQDDLENADRTNGQTQVTKPRTLGEAFLQSGVRTGF